MFKYMSWSFKAYELTQHGPPADDLLLRVASWLMDTSLFEEAWALVCFQPVNWWWSEQLCLFTVGAWTVFLAIEGKRHNIKYLWAYMLLGQIVAISVASNLFYLAILLSESASPPSPKTDLPSKVSVGPRLTLCVVLSLATVALSPSTSEKTFLPNLLVMHVLLFIPLIPYTSSSASFNSSSPSRFSISSHTLYRIIHIASAAIHVRTVIAGVEALSRSSATGNSALSMFAAAIKVLHSHPAQSSIGWDVIWTSVSFIAWMTARPVHPSEPSRYISVGYLMLATPAASIGVTAPYILQPRGEDPQAVSIKQE
ncbi:hypothetical protein B0H34DRAFT_9990 [Crassisporium funariophilum]|nr:hypothetical protein B0H34DRAFT_9990 [Crassisporium funariophilum]